MSIPENDTQLWKGFNGHGLYAKRAERDREGNKIIDTYAKKTDVPALTDSLTTSTTTAVTPNAVKSALDSIVKIPATANQPSTLYVGNQGIGWTGWESEEVDVPQKLPEHCVILDYFRDGYRLGKPAENSVFTSVESAIPTDFNIQSSDTFKQSVPFARFDGEGTLVGPNAYQLNDIVDPTIGFTVEYYIRTSESTEWVRDTAGLGNNEFKLMISGSNDGYYGYNNAGSWSWGHITIEDKSYLVSTPWHSSWHHIAYTVKYDENYKVQLYVDGIRAAHGSTITFSNWNPGNILSVWTYNYMNDSNTRSKCGYYDIAQLTVWDYPKYLDVVSFKLPTKFYID